MALGTRVIAREERKSHAQAYRHRGWLSRNELGQRCSGGLSGAADHGGRAVSGGRTHGHTGTHSGRSHENLPPPIHPHSKSDPTPPLHPPTPRPTPSPRLPPRP